MWLSCAVLVSRGIVIRQADTQRRSRGTLIRQTDSQKGKDTQREAGRQGGMEGARKRERQTDRHTWFLMALPVGWPEHPVDITERQEVPR